MSIANYSDLKTAVANWLNRSDLTSYVSDIVMLGEAKIYRELRIRAMETALSDTIASGVIAVPSDYIEMKHAYVDGSSTESLQRVSLERMYEAYPTRSADGKPKFYAREAGNFIFGPYPDSGYTVKGVYYKRMTALSDSNTTNWFTTNAPDILLWASLVEAEAFIKNDPRLPMWKDRYEESKAMIQDEDDKEAWSGGSPRARNSWK